MSVIPGIEKISNAEKKVKGLKNDQKDDSSDNHDDAVSAIGEGDGAFGDE